MLNIRKVKDDFLHSYRPMRIKNGTMSYNGVLSTVLDYQWNKEGNGLMKLRAILWVKWFMWNRVQGLRYCVLPTVRYLCSMNKIYNSPTRCDVSECLVLGECHGPDHVKIYKISWWKMCRWYSCYLLSSVVIYMSIYRSITMHLFKSKCRYQI